MDIQTITGELYDFLDAEGYVLHNRYQTMSYFRGTPSLEAIDGKTLTKNPHGYKHVHLGQIKPYTRAETLTFSEQSKSSLSIDAGLMQVKFFTHLYKKTSDITLYRQVGLICPNLTRQHYKEIFDSVSGEDFTKAILHVPAGELPLSTLDLSEFDQWVQTKNIPNIEGFYRAFFQKRTKSLSDPHAGPKVRDFLIETFGRDRNKLSFYFQMSPYVRDAFEDVAFDCFEHKQEFECSVQINPKKLVKVLAADNFSTYNVNFHLQMLARVWENKYNAVVIEESKRVKSDLEMRFYSDNPIDKKQLMQELEGFFKFMKNNQKFTEADVKVWHEKRELEVNFAAPVNKSKGFKL